MKATYKVLHDKAMEFVDEAQFAKMEGYASHAQQYLEKAFWLEKEAALSIPSTEATVYVKALYLRSAAYLAYTVGNLLEAFHLIQLGLAENPPPPIAKQLDDLHQKLQLQNLPLEMVGFFSQADANDNSITLQEEISKKAYHILVPTEKMRAIVKSYWSSKVAIVATLGAQGKFYLEKMEAVA